MLEIKHIFKSNPSEKKILCSRHSKLLEFRESQAMLCLKEMCSLNLQFKNKCSRFLSPKARAKHNTLNLDALFHLAARSPLCPPFSIFSPCSSPVLPVKAGYLLSALPTFLFAHSTKKKQFGMVLLQNWSHSLALLCKHAPPPTIHPIDFSVSSVGNSCHSPQTVHETPACADHSACSHLPL